KIHSSISHSSDTEEELPRADDLWMAAASKGVAVLSKKKKEVYSIESDESESSDALCEYDDSDKECHIKPTKEKKGKSKNRSTAMAKDIRNSKVRSKDGKQANKVGNNSKKKGANLDEDDDAGDDDGDDDDDGKQETQEKRIGWTPRKLSHLISC